MAEIDSRLLTAGHDLAALEGRLRLDVATGTESYTLLRGTPQAPKAGDMMICDEGGIISSIVYGPDQRTRSEPRPARPSSRCMRRRAFASGDPSALEQIRTTRAACTGGQTLLLHVYPWTEPNGLTKGDCEPRPGSMHSARTPTDCGLRCSEGNRARTQQCNGILVNSSHHGANQHPNRHGLEQGATHPDLPHVIARSIAIVGNQRSRRESRGIQ